MFAFRLQFGARIENMDQVIEQVITEVRKRHKRSLWGNVLLWLNEESSDDDGEEVKASTRRSTQRPSTFSNDQPSFGKSPRPTASYDSDGDKVCVLRRNPIGI